MNYSPQYEIKQKLLTYIFQPQLNFLNKKLRKLIELNCNLYNKNIYPTYSIYYKNKEWQPHSLFSNLFIGEQKINKTCLDSKLTGKAEQELDNITQEMTEIKQEIYEIDRFLSGLLIFNIHYRYFKEILGDNLFSICEKEFELFYCNNNENKLWNNAGDFSMKLYVDKYQDLITKMKNRVMANLVTLG